MTNNFPWLLRVPTIFEPVRKNLFRKLEAVGETRLGQDYYLVRSVSEDTLHDSDWSKFLSWNLPMEHTWPCNARKMEGFIEKAAQTLKKKFAHRKPQGVFAGPLNPGSPDKYYKGLASNLRGRVQQLFPDLAVSSVEEQDPEKETLFCLVGKEGLFCGMQSSQQCQGFSPGGSLYIDRDAPDSISRAGAKIAEALHYLKLYRPPLAEGSHWIELGASPGGMTLELLNRKQQVTAIDRAPMDKRLKGAPGLHAVLADVAAYQPKENTSYDAMLSDLNGPPTESIGHVNRLAAFLKPHGLVIFTLKVPRVENLEAPCAVFDEIVHSARGAQLQLLAETHLTGNRHEFTLFFEKRRF
ncbi:MAG: hypothetical protein GWQ05_21615 [Verrucomicrobiaceae bacterium]|nr:hypothetical protein [Verrucomicrobiaceae bacterium]